MSNAIARLDSILQRLEERLGLWAAAALVALVCMLVGAIYVRPGWEPISLGVDYAALAENPFSPSNPAGYRILTPLLAFVLGLRGNAIVYVNVLVAWLLLIIIYYQARRTLHGRLLSLALMGMLAFSKPTLFTIHFAGYTDSTTYLLTLLMILAVRYPPLFWFLFLLNLLNREAVAFLWPFFVLLSWQASSTNRLRWALTVAIGSGLSMGTYLAIRYILSWNMHVQYSSGYYFGPLLRDPLYWLRSTAPSYYVGVFTAFKLFWVVPVIATWYAAKDKDYMTCLLILTLIAGSAAQSILAVDISRLLSLAFPSLLLGVDILRRHIEERQLSTWLLYLVVANFFVPQLYVTWDKIWILRTTLSLLFKW
jgi:hypothetical protein